MNTSWDQYKDAADAAAARGDFATAESLWTQLLAAADAAGHHDARFALGLDSLGKVYAAQKRFPQAEAAYVKGIQVKEALFGPTSIEVAKTCNFLAALCYEQNKFEKTELLGSRALSIYQSLLGNDHPAVATMANNLGRLKQKIVRPATAPALPPHQPAPTYSQQMQSAAFAQPAQAHTPVAVAPPPPVPPPPPAPPAPQVAPVQQAPSNCAQVEPQYEYAQQAQSEKYGQPPQQAAPAFTAPGQAQNHYAQPTQPVAQQAQSQQVQAQLQGQLEQPQYEQPGLQPQYEQPQQQPQVIQQPPAVYSAPPQQYQQPAQPIYQSPPPQPAYQSPPPPQPVYSAPPQQQVQPQYASPVAPNEPAEPAEPKPPTPTQARVIAERKAKQAEQVCEVCGRFYSGPGCMQCTQSLTPIDFGFDSLNPKRKDQR